MELYIEDAFDSPIEISLGTAGDNELFLAQDEIDGNRTGYAVGDETNYEFTANETVYLFLSTSGSVTGNGHVQIKVRQS